MIQFKSQSIQHITPPIAKKLLGCLNQLEVKALAYATFYDLGTGSNCLAGACVHAEKVKLILNKDYSQLVTKMFPDQQVQEAIFSLNDTMGSAEPETERYTRVYATLTEIVGVPA